MRLLADYPEVLRVQWSPFLLDPTIPPQGRERAPYTQPGDPPTALEQRGERAGITFTRGRTFIPNSRQAMELAEWARDRGVPAEVEHDLHRRLFRAHHTDLANIDDRETLVAIAAAAGLPGAEARAALAEGRYTAEVERRLQWAYHAGVQAVPTFIFNDRYALVGAQEYPVFQRMMERFGHPPPPGAPPPPTGLRLSFDGDEAG